MQEQPPLPPRYVEHELERRQQAAKAGALRKEQIKEARKARGDRSLVRRAFRRVFGR